MVASDVDRERVERTLTDGYAHALHLEVERVRLQRRIDELTTALRRGDAGVKTRELSALSKLLDGNAADLMKLREILAELRRSAKR